MAEMAIASDKFEIGQRVQMSAKAIESGLQGKSNRTSCVVKGFSKKSLSYMDHRVLVRVHRDGDKQAKRYHMDFWELPSPPERS